MTETAVKPGLLEHFKSIIGDDVAMLFGETGTGKTKLCYELAIDVLRAGGQVTYLDTERNLSTRELAALGKSYIYTPLFQEIRDRIAALPKADLAIVDSIGMPILIRYSRMNMRDRLYAFLEMASMLGDLKDWTYRHGALAVVTNQPVSEFQVAEGEPRDPFGGKTKFVAKEIWQTAMVSRDGQATRLALTAFRSRELAFGTVIAEMTVTDAGLEVGWRLSRALSPGLADSLVTELEGAQTLEELAKVGQRVNQFKAQLTGQQRTVLREVYLRRRAEVQRPPADDVIPIGQTELMPDASAPRTEPS